MMWWIGGSLYGVALIICTRLLAGHWAWELAKSIEPRRPKPEGTDWAYAWIMAILACTLWPAVLAFILIREVIIGKGLKPLRVGAERAGHKELQRQQLAAAVERSDRLLKEMS